MGCFTLGFLMQLVIWAIILVALIQIIRLVLPSLLDMIGWPILSQIVGIILWAIVAVIAVYVIFMLLSCLLSLGGGINLGFHRF